MPLTQRSFSISTFSLLKLWFRAPTINFREGDVKKINSQIKSWLFYDQLEYPEEIILHRSRKQGGLGLINVRIKAQSELIRSFLETATIKSCKTNIFHAAIFRYYILQEFDLPFPGNHPYLSADSK